MSPLITADKCLALCTTSGSAITSVRIEATVSRYVSPLYSLGIVY